MRRSDRPIQLLVLAIALALSSVVLGQEVSPSAQASNITEGQQLAIEGLVTKRDADGYTVREFNGREIVVVLNRQTSVRVVRKGVFRRDRDATASDLLPGLRLKAKGRTNSHGELLASSIRFEERDLRSAQALQVRIEPVESLAKATQILAESNETRIDYHQIKLDAAEQNAQRLTGQVDELSGVANSAVTAVKNAQSAADEAEADANTANQRIDSLGDYEVVNITQVHFRRGSSVLSKAAKVQIDAAVDSFREKNLKGWIVSVSGFADSTGKASQNRILSERRANAVVNYLVTQHSLPLERLVQPYGFGSLNPARTNHTGQGQALNRRAEIRVLVNKGISTASM